MPQLDVNAFIPIIFCLFVCYCFLFLVIYLFFFLPLINLSKIRLIWQHKQVLSVYLLYSYMRQVSSYDYMQMLLNILQSNNLHISNSYSVVNN